MRIRAKFHITTTGTDWRLIVHFELNKTESVKMKEPELLIVITGGGMAFRRKDGVCIIPIGCLRE